MEVSATYAAPAARIYPRYYKPAARKSFQMAFDQLQALPDQKEWEGNHQVEMLMLDGTWHWRRIIWTKSTICFTRIDENTVIESIPLHEADQIMTQDNENVRKVGGKVARDSKRDSCEDGSAGTKGKPGTKISTVFGRFFLFRKPNLNARVDVDSSAPAAEEVDDPRLALENLQHSTARFELNSIANANGKLAGQAKGSSKLLQIRTVPEGFNSGRTYYVRFSSNALCQEVVLELTNKANEARKKLLKLTRFQKNQELVRVVFISKYFQFTVAALIFANFVVNAAQAQLNAGLTTSDGSLTDTGQTLNKLDITFTCIFTFELLINAYAHWFIAFFNNYYNLIDIVVISLSLASLGPLNVPASVLRMIRAVRVIRLFGRLKSFKTIIGALTASILPVFNAFLLLLIVISIYAILGVTYFSDLSPTDFSAFDRAFVALFRIPAGDAWIDSLPYVNDDGSTNIGVILFLDSFILVVNWTLLPITLAILVNNFVIISTDNEKEERERIYREKKSQAMITYPLDPLIEYLTKQYVDDADLSDRLQRLFKELDTDDSKSISFLELCAALKKLDYRPRIHMTELDFASITSNGQLCDEKGMLGAAEFEAAMRKEIRRYAQRQLADALNHEQFTVAEFAQLASLKMLSLAPSPAEPFLHSSHRMYGEGLPNVSEEPETPGSARQDQVSLLKREVKGLRDEIRTEVASLRAEMSEGISTIRNDLQHLLQQLTACSQRLDVPVLGPMPGDDLPDS